MSSDFSSSREPLDASNAPCRPTPKAMSKISRSQNGDIWRRILRKPSASHSAHTDRLLLQMQCRHRARRLGIMRHDVIDENRSAAFACDSKFAYCIGAGCCGVLVGGRKWTFDGFWYSRKLRPWLGLSVHVSTGEMRACDETKVEVTRCGRRSQLTRPIADTKHSSLSLRAKKSPGEQQELANLVAAVHHASTWLCGGSAACAFGVCEAKQAAKGRAACMYLRARKRGGGSIRSCGLLSAGSHGKRSMHSTASRLPASTNGARRDKRKFGGSSANGASQVWRSS